MAHCLWVAYRDYLDFLWIDVNFDERMVYSTFKFLGQKSVEIPTWGGVVPWVLWGLATRRDLETVVQHDIWTPEHYLADATPVQTRIINFSDFGERGITLAPAIYCDLDTQHAVFAEEIPNGNIVLAIQLRRKGESNGT